MSKTHLTIVNGRILFNRVGQIHSFGTLIILKIEKCFLNYLNKVAHFL